jgi:LPXTG-motif cell wall-anchored protein
MEPVKLRNVVGTFLLTLFLGTALATAASAQYPPQAANGRVTKSTVGPGGCVTFSGDGFAPGSTVTVTDNNATVGTATASVTGTFSLQVCPQVLGVHILRGTGKTPTGATRVVVAQVRVVQASRLPSTGSDKTLETVALGAGLVVAGAGAVAFARRRRTRAAAA